MNKNYMEYWKLKNLTKQIVFVVVYIFHTIQVHDSTIQESVISKSISHLPKSQAICTIVVHEYCG